MNLCAKLAVINSLFTLLLLAVKVSSFLQERLIRMSIEETRVMMLGKHNGVIFISSNRFCFASETRAFSADSYERVLEKELITIMWHES